MGFFDDFGKRVTDVGQRGRYKAEEIFRSWQS